MNYLRNFNIESTFDRIMARLRFFQSPWIILISIVLFFASSFSIGSFEDAMTPEEAAALDYPLMPSHWEAGVRNHGEYYQWFTIENHQLFYYVSIAVLLFSCLSWACIVLSIIIDAEIIRTEMKRKYRKGRSS